MKLLLVIIASFLIIAKSTINCAAGKASSVAKDMAIKTYVAKAVTNEASARSFIAQQEKLGFTETELKRRAMKNKIIAEKLVYEKSLESKNGVSKRIIMYGTKWCGHGNKADETDSDSAPDLGSMARMDNCCRNHDNCKFSIPAEHKRWGVQNHMSNTMSDCSCDDSFYSCLKELNGYGKEDWAAWAVGKVFYNIKGIQCVAVPDGVDQEEQATGIEGSDEDYAKKYKGVKAKSRKAKHFKK